MAGKKHYFGVGGGTRQFLHMVEEDGELKVGTNNSPNFFFHLMDFFPFLSPFVSIFCFVKL